MPRLLLRDLLASGVEVPYEVRETGAGSPLAEYVPQTSAFIRDNASQLAALDSYGTTCAALESDGLATSYLEEMGVPVPADGRRRAELAGVVFLCRLWQGSTDFTLDDARIDRSRSRSFSTAARSRLGEVEIAVPLRGFQMEVEKLELAGATIVRSDTVDVPTEARGMDGMGGAAWEPSFLVVARIDAIGAEDDEQRRRHSRGCRLQAGRDNAPALQGRRRRAGPARLGQGRRRPLAPVSTGAGTPAPGRLSPGGRGARRPRGALARARAHVSTPFHRMTRGEGGFARDPRPAPSRASRQGSSARSRSKRSTTTS